MVTAYLQQYSNNVLTSKHCHMKTCTKIPNRKEIRTICEASEFSNYFLSFNYNAVFTPSVTVAAGHSSGIALYEWCN